MPLTKLSKCWTKKKEKKKDDTSCIAWLSSQSINSPDYIFLQKWFHFVDRFYPDGWVIISCTLRSRAHIKEIIYCMKRNFTNYVIFRFCFLNLYGFEDWKERRWDVWFDLVANWLYSLVKWDTFACHTYPDNDWLYNLIWFIYKSILYIFYLVSLHYLI